MYTGKESARKETNHAESPSGSLGRGDLPGRDVGNPWMPARKSPRALADPQGWQTRFPHRPVAAGEVAADQGRSQGHGAAQAAPAGQGAAYGRQVGRNERQCSPLRQG